MTEKLPKRKTSDVLHTLAKAGIAAVPFGGSATELLSLVLAPSLEKRRDKWLEDTANDLKALETKVEGFKIENLKENEAFVDVMLHSWKISMRNHQKEKLEALRNAVLNAALPSAPEEDLQHMFLTFVDSFTPWHIRILQRLDELEVIYNEKNLNGFFPELEDRQDFCSQIFRDLHSCGLTPLLYSTDDIVVYKHQPIEHNVTHLGKQFLQFITLSQPLIGGCP
ncbi:hypothetical protein ACFL3Q_06430 [Planctomycetota bacterium]